MSLNFQLDEDLSYRVAEGLRQRGVDAPSVHEVSRAIGDLVRALAEVAQQHESLAGLCMALSRPTS